MRHPTRLALLLALAGLIPACGTGKAGARGLQGPSGPAGVVINSVSALPPVLVPNAASIFTVSATDGAGGALTYAWTASDGLLSSPSGNPVTWTAPDTSGAQTIQVTATNGAGDNAVAILSILVSTSPSGPVVTSVNPGRAHRGDDVIVTGGAFGATQGSGFVTISGANATVISWSDTAVRVFVPPTAVPGGVVVTVGGQASTPGLLDVLIDDNFPIFTGGDTNLFPQVVSDGSGGAIVIWSVGDFLLRGIYGQRYDSSGIPQWGGSPVVLVSAMVANELVVIPDGSGGAIMAFSGYRGGSGSDIAVQRVDGSGAPLWGASGVTICAAAEDQLEVQLTTDGAGGTIVCWDDTRTLATFDVYAQRVNGAGVAQWTPDGIPVNQGLNAAFTAPQISADGFGGAILIWDDLRGGEADIYGQRLNSVGTPQWAVNGLLVGGVPGSYQKGSALVADGTGGAFLVWGDQRSFSSQDLYAQRINGSGTSVWTAGGVAVCAASGDQTAPRIILDASGGAIAVWRDLRSGSGGDVYAQRVDGSGAVQWATDGVALTGALGTQTSFSVIPDGSGGVIAAWQDSRFGDFDLYAQRLDASGATLWTPDGTVLSSAVDDQILPQLISDGSGGAFVVWQDDRDSSLANGVRSYIYGQFIDGAGVRY